MTSSALQSDICQKKVRNGPLIGQMKILFDFQLSPFLKKKNFLKNVFGWSGLHLSYFLTLGVLGGDFEGKKISMTSNDLKTDIWPKNVRKSPQNTKRKVTKFIFSK